MDPSILELCLCAKLGECSCQQTELAEEIVRENASDTAKAIYEVIKLCGVSTLKANLAYPVIETVLINYDEEVYRVDMPPKKHLRGTDLFLKLVTESRCGRLESQIIYSIVKRAFRALYFCTGRNGIYNPKLETRCKHEVECLWSHAAKKTAQIYNKFEGFFTADEKVIEFKIKCIYKQLFDQLKNRYETNKDQIKCTCKRWHMHGKKFKRPLKCCISTYCKQDRKLKNAGKCNCNELFCQCPGKVIKPKCDCEKLECICSPEDFHLSSNCDQGPYHCQWVPMTEEDICVQPLPPSSEVCTSDDEGVCECECICEDELSWYDIEEEQQPEDDICKKFRFLVPPPSLPEDKIEIVDKIKEDKKKKDDVYIETPEDIVTQQQKVRLTEKLIKDHKIKVDRVTTQKDIKYEIPSEKEEKRITTTHLKQVKRLRKEGYTKKIRKESDESDEIEQVVEKPYRRKPPTPRKEKPPKILPCCAKCVKIKKRAQRKVPKPADVCEGNEIEEIPEFRKYLT